MPFFCHQLRFTNDGWTRSLDRYPDRFDSVRVPIENLGGLLRVAFFTTGSFDVLAISEFPAQISSTEVASAFAEGGLVAFVDTALLLTARDAQSLWGTLESWQYTAASDSVSPRNIMATIADEAARVPGKSRAATAR